MSLEAILSFVITLMVFSYVLGDNVLYRIAMYVFVGITAATVTIVTVENVIIPLLISNEIVNLILLAVASVLTLLLLLKPIPIFKPFGNIALAFLIAVGSAVAVVGAMSGTILPFIQAVGVPQSNLLDGIIIVVGMITSLMYFQYSARQRRDGTIGRGRILRPLSLIGEGFIVVTLGAVYGVAILSALTILTGHLNNLNILLGR
jgi:hypothetical protein